MLVYLLLNFGFDKAPHLAVDFCYSFAYTHKTEFGGIVLMASGPNSREKYEIRCPVHGFIRLSDWEMGIVAQPAFQRLRRIRQLAWTDEIYPGAMHTRFEHSLGVMHTATLLYHAILRNSQEVLESELAYDEAGFKRYRQLVRLAALLHDVGHGPFSHAAEELFPRSNVSTGMKTIPPRSSVLVYGPRLRIIPHLTTTGLTPTTLQL